MELTFWVLEDRVRRVVSCQLPNGWFVLTEAKEPSIQLRVSQVHQRTKADKAFCWLRGTAAAKFLVKRAKLMDRARRVSSRSSLLSSSEARSECAPAVIIHNRRKSAQMSGCASPISALQGSMDAWEEQGEKHT